MQSRLEVEAIGVLYGLLRRTSCGKDRSFLVLISKLTLMLFVEVLYLTLFASLPPAPCVLCHNAQQAM